MIADIKAWFCWCLLAILASVGINADGGHGGKHVIIKVPEHIHVVKHTHTIYKTIHHHPEKHHEEHHSHGGKPFHWH